MNFLSSFCSATIVLCSATQPCFDFANDYPIHFAQSHELVTFDEQTADIFKRTDIIFMDKKGGYDCGEICDMALKRLKTEQSVLIICNTKANAECLYKKLSDTILSDTELYYLSTSLCTKRRHDTLMHCYYHYCRPPHGGHKLKLLYF